MMDEDERQMLALRAAGYTADVVGGWIVAPDGVKYGSIAEAYASLVAAEEMVEMRQAETPDSAFYASDLIPENDFKGLLNEGDES